MTRPLAVSKGPWTANEDATLQRLKGEGISPIAIAKQVGRPESSVYRRLDTLAARPVRRARPCMCCRQPFMSEGPHNRLCGRCRGKETSPYQP